jgi:hypothetical protein
VDILTAAQDYTINTNMSDLDGTMGIFQLTESDIAAIASAKQGAADAPLHLKRVRRIDLDRVLQLETHNEDLNDQCVKVQQWARDASKYSQLDALRRTDLC